MDNIIYLQKGRPVYITELGTHDELMNLNGDYKDLFQIQAKYYKQPSQIQEVLYEN